MSCSRGEVWFRLFRGNSEGAYPLATKGLAKLRPVGISACTRAGVLGLPGGKSTEGSK